LGAVRPVPREDSARAAAIQRGSGAVVTRERSSPRQGEGDREAAEGADRSTA
jgi:hypothetical protein